MQLCIKAYAADWRRFMTANKGINWKRLILALVVSLGAGVISWLLTGNSMEMYKNLHKPILSPPGQLFPVVWTVLYIFMGLASFLVYTSDKYTKPALTLYCTQLFLNFMWSIIFFNLQMYLAAFFWLFLMWFLIIITIVLFYEICKPAAYLMIPYLVWVTYAGYLNLAIYMLN